MAYSGPQNILVGAGEEDPAGRRFARHHAGASLGVFEQGDTADGGLGLILDALFGLGGAVPMGVDEPAFFVEHLLEGSVVINPVGHRLTAGFGCLEEVDLDGLEDLLHGLCDAIHRNSLFGACVTACKFDHTVGHIAWTDGKSYRNSTYFMFRELESWFVLVACVETGADAGGLELGEDLVAVLGDQGDLFVGLPDGYDHALGRC
jgi:hypothetical protein